MTSFTVTRQTHDYQGRSYEVTIDDGAITWKQAQFAGIPWFQPRECQFPVKVYLSIGDPFSALVGVGLRGYCPT